MNPQELEQFKNDIKRRAKQLQPYAMRHPWEFPIKVRRILAGKLYKLKSDMMLYNILLGRVYFEHQTINYSHSTN